MGERHTFKAIIFCLDKHEIYPLVIIELQEALKEVFQCTVKDLRTSTQPASGFYLCVIHSSHMAAEHNTLTCIQSCVLHICVNRQ